MTPDSPEMGAPACSATACVAGPTSLVRPWMRRALIAAALYNLLWGGLVIAFPYLIFDLVGAERPRYPQIWQCVGMIVGVYGVGYAVAASSPLPMTPSAPGLL